LSTFTIGQDTAVALPPSMARCRAGKHR